MTGKALAVSVILMSALFAAAEDGGLFTDGVFATCPVVYAVGDEYQIIVPVNLKSVMWCEVGDKSYYDDASGILRSETATHRMTVPMAELDAAKAYTICYRAVDERLPYFSKTGEVRKAGFAFRPVSGDTLDIYHIADAHNRVAAPVAAAGFFETPDLLILNGDIPEDGGDIANYTTIHEIAGQITRGSIPVIFSRGNHDMRGVHAEELTDHTPHQDGNTYYTFRLGPLWGIVLDCGEDKPDANAEYGNTIACHPFRLRQTEFLKKVIADAENEYAAPDVQYRLVVSHVPFPQVFDPPFDIEQDIYREWCALLRDQVKPQLMLSGHVHRLYITHPGDERDHLGQPCPVVAGSRPGPSQDEYTGTALTLSPEGMLVRFTDQDRQVQYQETIPF